MQNNLACFAKARFLILGGRGQLGREFSRLLEDGGIAYAAYDLQEVDISDIDEMKSAVSAFKPDFLINCSAYNFVDLAESEYDKAYAANSQGPLNIARLSADFKIKAVHYSTDYVFDGAKQSDYSEVDKPNPLNNYGKTKLLGENLFLENSENNLVFRLSWVYGEGQQNFIAKLQNWSEKSNILRIADDEVSVPSSTAFIAENTLLALKATLGGLYHLVPEGNASRYEWAAEIVRLLKLPVELQAAKMDEFSLKAERPKISIMNSGKIQRDLNVCYDIWCTYLSKYLLNS